MTISGIDDGTTAQELIEITKEYPFVEWGLLLSSRKDPMPRYPTTEWFLGLESLTQQGVRFSGHICGSWARKICEGIFPEEIDRPMFSRIQLNIAQFIKSGIKDVRPIASCLPRNRENIIQVGSALREGLDVALGLKQFDFTVSVLFDSSGGHGVTPEHWPTFIKGIKCGFAGGLGFDNLAKELNSLASYVKDTSIWIDMESKVRTDDNMKIDLEKVRRCLDIASQFAIIKFPPYKFE